MAKERGIIYMSYADACSADLQEQCPGFLAIEQAKKSYADCIVCEHCLGRGKVRYYHGDFDTCPTCHGTGKVQS